MKLSLLPLATEERPPVPRYPTDTEAITARNRARRIRLRGGALSDRHSLGTGMNREAIRATSRRLDNVHTWGTRRRSDIVHVNRLLFGNACPICSTFHSNAVDISMYYGTDMDTGIDSTYTLRNVASSQTCFGRILEEYRWHQNVSVGSGTYNIGTDIRGLFGAAVRTLASRGGRRRVELSNYRSANPNEDLLVRNLTGEEAATPESVENLLPRIDAAIASLLGGDSLSPTEDYQENDEN